MARKALLVLALSVGACSSTGESLELPLGVDWQAATTNGVDDQDGVWELRRLGDVDVLELVDVAGHTDQEYNLTWAPGLAPADLDLTVRLQRIDGVEDQGGGPAWRIQGPDDYYVARWNPLEHNYRVYLVEGGYRHELGSATVYAQKDGWHELRVRMVGDAITCWLDGHEQLSVSDATHTEPGHVGLWTKADARTRFTRLVVGPAE
ncbi:MAG: hypothetical protein P1V81_08560 [Planctomycetota bacterium]|nr:hypothetical protein [Planctomycetota bacterium]